ncbi:MAG: hemolysin III family protein [Spirochaetaceae bacterium]|jgi:hemolysin III|nr:hemolysin III family protein [Spirochaetaceae bacterium]
MTHIKSRRALPVGLSFQTPGEETANAVLHGAGVLLAITGMVFLVLRNKGYVNGGTGGPLGVYITFTSTMISMFLASTLYHAIRHERAKRVLRIIDHAGIYLFIAGTCTPVCLLGLRGALGWVCFGIEWACAIAGITLYAVNCKALKKIEIGVYLMMGWAIVLCWFRLDIPFISFVLLIAGGLAYTLGIFWYIKRSRRGTHVIWHIFVLAGAAGHWWAIWFMS